MRRSFNSILMYPALSSNVQEESCYEEKLARSKLLLDESHEAVFTHGDLSQYYIIITEAANVSAPLG